MKHALAGAFLFASLLATGATGASAADIEADMVEEPVLAEWYVAISGGLNKVFDLDYEADNNPFPFNDFDDKIEFDWGFRGGAAIGRRFGNFRAELEFAGSSTDADEVNDNDVGGDLDIFSVLAKLDLEMEFFGWWHPYIGVGAGVAHVSLDDIGTSGGDRLDDSETTFAAAIEGGSMFELSENVELFTQTQLMFLGDIDSELEVNGADVDLEDLMVLSSSVGLRLKF
jgi:opacity protein-like surface antigen